MADDTKATDAGQRYAKALFELAVETKVLPAVEADLVSLKKALTDSADLRPGAVEKLRPLAGYLRANPGVRVAIIGHTDSRGTDAHNQSLSERRAESVRTAFDEMGVTRARFRVEGRGEGEPVATNGTPEGMRLNRRVEVTLLGERADRFDRDN